MRRLGSLARTLRQGLAAEGFAVADREMHIIPLLVGDQRNAMALCQGALERGVFAQGIRPPSVPAGTARLRLTVMASHTPAELRRAARSLGDAARGLGLDPSLLGEPLERHAGTDHGGGSPAEPADEPSPGSPVGGRPHSSAPFDIEREDSLIRAA